MATNLIQTKTFAFSLQIISVYKLLQQEREYVLSKQLLRCSTSVGAMVMEADHAESRADFRHKMSIAQKEINESIYWLKLLEASNYLSSEQLFLPLKDANDILHIITRILITVKQNMNLNT
jgi:four helix bundle protein